MKTNEIRKMWLEFFKEKGHHVQENKSLVPVNDDSLLFINSGVATIKHYLDGREKPVANRITNAQRSLRTNDIENVGKTTRHHTLFEMLGNFSIGDYFKDEAIEYAYELLLSPKWFNMSVDDLYFTVHPSDKETYDKWLSLGINEDRIVKTEDNFWEIGKGPGGPNTEIFFDRGQEYDERTPQELLKDDLENDRVIEIWNIVFSQYNCDPENKSRNEYKELPQKNIDTGMGLERMACILQGVDTNFETDNFQIIINELEKIAGKNYEENKYPFRVIADHIRALTFAVNDGVLPSNEGRGYILRRLIRRSITVAYLDLDIKSNFLGGLVDIIEEVNRDIDKTLKDNIDKVKKVIKTEEDKFFKTIKSGMNLAFKIIHEKKYVSGEDAFKLYDTYGFPIEITMEIAEKENVEVDVVGFNENMEKQRQRARNAQKKVSAINYQSEVFSNIDVESTFIGYDELSTNAIAVFIATEDEQIQTTEGLKEAYVILDKTPFYAEMGGQVADNGYINNSRVVDVQKLATGQFLHKIECADAIEVGQKVLAKVDKKRRNNTEKNHSATHLLNYALNKVLGGDIKQAGSYNNNLKIRFDFTFDRALTQEELKEVSKIVNSYIRKNNKSEIKSMSIEEAKNTGAKMQFEDKYGDTVRVVKIGDSIELCGGTHVINTSIIKGFHIINETSVGSGVRRIEAITDKEVDKYEVELLDDVRALISDSKERIENGKKIDKTKIKQTFEKLTLLQEATGLIYTKEFDKIVDLEKMAKDKKKDSKKNKVDMSTIKESILSSIEVIDGISIIDKTFSIEDGVGIAELRNLSDELINEVENVVIKLQLKMGNKLTMIVKVTKEITDKYNASEILNDELSKYGGRGGGSPVMAQGGATIE